MLIDNKLYLEDMDNICRCGIDWDRLDGAGILITGAAGMIGTCLADALMYRNRYFDQKINIYASGRSKNKLEKRFAGYCGEKLFHIFEYDVTKPLVTDAHLNYIIHAASNSYPKKFADDPVGTMLGNFMGAYNLLQYARENKTKRLLYISSGEVYGEGNGCDFKEDYSGYVDSTSPRACYPSGKRAAETLCASYAAQYGTDVVIARPSHVYGPAATDEDTRASSQFIRDAVLGKDIVMKSRGEQVRSYTYIADCVSALLAVLDRGISGNAYNISNKDSVVSIMEMSRMTAEYAGVDILFDFPDETEKRGFSTVKRAVLNSDKLGKLGWSGRYGIKEGIRRTVDILRSVKKEGIKYDVCGDSRS